MSKNNNKLSRRLSLGIMLLAVPIFVLSLGLLFLQSRDLIHQEVLECTNSALNTTLQRVHNYMSTIETAANSNVWMLEENYRPDSLQSVSNRIVRLNPNVISSSVFAVPDMFSEYGHKFSIYTEDKGNGIVETYCEPDYDYFDKACYTNPINSGNACWVDPFVDYSDGKIDYNEAVATYCRPIRQNDGRIVGVVTADFSFSRMAKMLNEAEHSYRDAYYILLSGDGRYLVHPDSTRLFRKTVFTDADPSKDMDVITLGHEMTAGKEGAMHVISDGVQYHVCYRPVPGTNWSLALFTPDNEAMKSFYNLGYVIIVLIIIGLLVILMLCHRLVRDTIGPINRLIDTTRKMEEGQFDETIPISPHENVVGQLQNSFAEMQQSWNEHMSCLRQNTDEIRQHNEELSRTKQVAEDTVLKKDRFIHHLIPQMRMSLNAVMGFANVLGEGSSDKNMITDEELTSISGMMKNNVINMNRIVLMLHDASETDATETLMGQRVDEVSCNAISQECIQYIQSHFPQTAILFETELHDVNCLLTNHYYLMCILRELLYNAVRYSDGKHIVLNVTQTETTVCFAVQDTGSGLPADLPDMTFKPFTMTGDLPEGIGLGLPLARRLTGNLGGRLIFDTDYHDGCRIIVELPR